MTRRIICRHQPLSEDGYRAAMGVTQSTFIDTVRCTLEIVAGCSRRPGGLRPDELDAMAEAAWEVFLDNMKGRRRRLICRPVDDREPRPRAGLFDTASKWEKRDDRDQQ
jgi:hypothetical protein